MAKKTDFTEQEWDQLGGGNRRRPARLRQRPELLRQLQGGGLARQAPRGRPSGESELIRELSGERGTGFGLTSSPQEIESGTLDALRPRRSRRSRRRRRTSSSLQVVRAGAWRETSARLPAGRRSRGCHDEKIRAALG